jgi:hypothetical protein
MSRLSHSFSKYNAVLRALGERVVGLSGGDDEPSPRRRSSVGASGPQQDYMLRQRSCSSVSSRLQKNFEKLCGGKNRYVTTIHLINSAVLKLARLSALSTRVYRGIRGNCFKSGDGSASGGLIGCGGVEYGFMSTTLEAEVARRFAGVGDASERGVVFSISQGLFDRGADLSWLSQYVT